MPLKTVMTVLSRAARPQGFFKLCYIQTMHFVASYFAYFWFSRLGGRENFA